MIGSTITDANGTFTFSGLAGGSAVYTVRLSDSGGVLTNYFGTTDYARAKQRAESNLTASIDRVAAPPPSYGFQVTRAIGDTVFFDLNGNGTQDAGENGIAGAPGGFYRDTGTIGRIDNDQNGTIDETQVGGEVLTDANGRYLFAGLTNGNYVVSVVGPAGYAPTPALPAPAGGDQDTATAGVQRAYTMSGTNIDTADFGFRSPAGQSRTISGVLWSNDDGDAVVDAGEARLSGVTVQILSGSNPLTATLVATLTTDANGAYSLSGLLAGTYVVRVTDTNGALAGYTPNYEKTAGPFDYLEVVNASSADVTDVNFGYVRPVPTHAAIASVRAYLAAGAVTVEWRTSLEVGTVGSTSCGSTPSPGSTCASPTTSCRPCSCTGGAASTASWTQGPPRRGRSATSSWRWTGAVARVPTGLTRSPCLARPPRETSTSASSATSSRGRSAAGPSARRARLDLRTIVSTERKVAALRRLKRQGRVLKVTTREAGVTPSPPPRWPCPSAFPRRGSRVSSAPVGSRSATSATRCRTSRTVRAPAPGSTRRPWGVPTPTRTRTG